MIHNVRIVFNIDYKSTKAKADREEEFTHISTFATTLNVDSERFLMRQPIYTGIAVLIMGPSVALFEWLFYDLKFMPTQLR